MYKGRGDTGHKNMPWVRIYAEEVYALEWHCRNTGR